MNKIFTNISINCGYIKKVIHLPQNYYSLR